MSYAYRFKIRFDDTDAYGIVHHSCYYHYFEQARIEYSVKKLNFDITKIVELKFPVIESFCQYRRPIVFSTSDYVVRVDMRIVDDIKYEFRYAILDESEKIKYAIGKTVHVFIDKDNKVSLNLPECFNTVAIERVQS